MRQWLAAAGGNTRAPAVAAGRGGELRGLGTDDDVAAEQHATASLRGLRECFLRSCRSRQLSLLRVTTYLIRPRYETNLQ